jgi:hypothetical protein
MKTNNFLNNNPEIKTDYLQVLATLKSLPEEEAISMFLEMELTTRKQEP